VSINLFIYHNNYLKCIIIVSCPTVQEVITSVFYQKILIFVKNS